MSDRIEPVPDTSDERLVELIRWTGKSGMPDVHALLLDLQRRRAAQAASAERVRSVVRTACLEVLMFDESVDAGQIERIADRVAAQLGLSGLSQPDRVRLRRIKDLLDKQPVCWDLESSLIDRLLGGRDAG